MRINSILKKSFIFLCIICTIICTIIPIAVYSVAGAKAARMSANCIDYFKMAADASSVELAEKHLTSGIEYLETHDLTEGSTKIFIYSPKTDLGLWYENLKTAQSQLQELIARDDLTELEESNALMKLRETLCSGEESVTAPLLISFYPEHASWLWGMALIWLLWVAAGVFGIIASEI